MNPRLRAKSNLLSGFNLICPVQSRLEKYCASRLTQITFISPLSCPSERGVGHRHERWDGMRWTQGVLKTKALFLRTEKSCGPDASTLASSSWEASFLGATVAKKPIAGESTKEAVKTIACGDAGSFRCDRGD